jgi:hypothetical protein
MANEVEIISNPTSTPAAVSTGYQRQNTRMVAASVGMDNTIVEGGAAQVTCLISGPVDVNGVLYTIKTEAILALTTAGRWYIYLETGGDVSYLTPTLTDDPGAYDETKFARYTSANKRILNWLIDFDGTTARVTRWVTPEYSGNQNSFPDLDTQPETWITADGTWAAPRSKYYTIWVTGQGGTGGDGGYPTNQNSGGGGNGGATGIKRMFINAGDVWTATFGTNTTTFTNGVTTLTAYRGNTGTRHYIISPPNAPYAGTSTGFDQVIEGGMGSFGFLPILNDYAAPGTKACYIGGNGGPSFYGGGGNGAYYERSSNARVAYAGLAPGAGGGGGIGISGYVTGGLGAAGIIRIIG